MGKYELMLFIVSDEYDLLRDNLETKEEYLSTKQKYFTELRALLKTIDG